MQFLASYEMTMLAGVDTNCEEEGEDQMSQQTFNVSENVRINVQNCHNRVTVIGWDDAQHVSVDYAARQEGDAIIVEDADEVTVRVPRRAIVKIEDCEADVRVEDLDGSVELEHIGGDVSLRSLRGEVIARDVDGDLSARDVASLKGEGSWDGDVGLHDVKSFQAEQVKGALAMSDIQAASVDRLEGDLTARNVKALKGAADWEGDVGLRDVESIEVDEIEGDVSMSELGAVKIRSIHGDLNAYNVRGSIAMDEVKGDLNLREVGGSVSLDSVEGDFIASGIHGALQVADIDGDAVVSMAAVAQMDLRAKGDVVINLPAPVNAEIELDAPHGQLVAHADIKVTEEDESHVRGTLGSGGAKIRAESAKGDLILRAGGSGRHHVHASVRRPEFADMGQRIAEEVRESMRDSFKGWRFNAQPKIKIKHKKHWGGWHEEEEDREEQAKPRGPAAGSPERQTILDAIARGELNVDDAIKKLRGE